MGVWRLIKDLQAELMASAELPHVVSVRLLARLDEAERHLGFGGFERDAAHSAQPPAEATVEAAQPPLVEQSVVDLDGGPSSTLGVTEEK